MSLHTEGIATNWIDDQLDLYSLAIRLGDVEWQQQVLERLINKDALILREIQSDARHRLWDRFDEINSRMVIIYRQIRELANSEEQHALREKAWELKRERVAIGQQLRKQAHG